MEIANTWNLRLRNLGATLASYLCHVAYLLFAQGIVVVDQYSKYLVVKRLPYGSTVEVIPNLFNLTFVKNFGAAFGLFQNQLAVFVVVAVVAISVIVVYSFVISEKEYTLQIGLAFLLGGAIGNFIDRLRLGYVIDFLHLHRNTWHWPVFNIADIAIDIGVVLILLKFLFTRDEEQEPGEEENPG